MFSFDVSSVFVSRIEIIILILLFAIICAGFYLVGEIFSESIEKTPLSKRLALMDIFFCPAILDVPFRYCLVMQHFVASYYTRFY